MTKFIDHFVTNDLLAIYQNTMDQTIASRLYVYCYPRKQSSVYRTVFHISTSALQVLLCVGAVVLYKNSSTGHNTQNLQTNYAVEQVKSHGEAEKVLFLSPMIRVHHRVQHSATCEALTTSPYTWPLGGNITEV